MLRPEPPGQPWLCLPTYTDVQGIPLGSAPAQVRPAPQSPPAQAALCTKNAHHVQQCHMGGSGDFNPSGLEGTNPEASG